MSSSAINKTTNNDVDLNCCSVEIDGNTICVSKNTTILEAAGKLGVQIPTLCYLRGCSEISSCRVCMVQVSQGDDSSSDSMVPACSTPIEEGMVIQATSEKLYKYRKMIIELIAKNLRRELKSKNKFSNLCSEYEVNLSQVNTSEISAAVRDVLCENPFISFDPSACVSCQRCVGACNESARNHSLGTLKIATRTHIAAPFGVDWQLSGCETCGNCAQACPTGAISMKRTLDHPINAEGLEPAKKVRTTCPHCGVGCQLDLLVQDNKILNCTAAHGPSNESLVCIKGRSLSIDFVDDSRRVRTPLIKNANTGQFEAASWDEALSLVASKFTSLKNDFGSDSLAAFACSRSTNEDIYMLQKLARCAFKTNNIDNCARV